MKHRFVRYGSIVALCALLLGMFASVQQPTASFAADTAPRSVDDLNEATVTGKVYNEAKGETISGTYIVQLANEPLASYKGGKSNLAPTSPVATGQSKLNLDSVASRNYRAYLSSERATVLNAVEGITKEKANLSYTYDVAFNGFALTMTPEQATKVASLSGVLRVQREFMRFPQTDAGPRWINADDIWDGTATEMYIATILGKNEVSPTSSTASGNATLDYDDGTNTLSYNVTLSSNITPTAAHIHRGAAGVNGPVIVGLTSTGSQTYFGNTVLSGSDETLLRSGGLYLNFHTTAFAGGEIRGQITGLQGEGIVVGVIDTGINFDHPSFAATGDDGYTHVNPLGTGNYVGFCNPSNPFYSPTVTICNSKLIGAWGFASTFNNPEDNEGHGSHTASTAAGNVILNASVNGIAIGRISGVAPHSNIIAYDACNPGGCPLAALTAAIDQATADGVDVINYSIGGGSTDPWNDSDSLAFLAARDAGVFVATSAGNSGPDASTIGSPADSPWVTAVGASTHNRVFVNSLKDLTGGSTTPPDDIKGKGLNGGYGPAPIVDAAAAPYNNPTCNPFPANTFTNQIVVCLRGGGTGRVKKGQNVLDAGGNGMVLVNDEASGNSLLGDPHVLPAVHITYNDGVDLKAWLATGTGHMGTIQGQIKDLSDENGDIMASFSSRGFNASVAGSLKPDVVAPGVDIIAAFHTDGVTPAPEFNSISGTSMASPHTAGAASLLRQLHPTWTAAEVQSALMLTGKKTGIRKEDGVTPADPFDFGGGRIDVALAANTGLVLNETKLNYEDANPGENGVPSDLNIASLQNNDCLGICVWTRVLRNPTESAISWNATADVTDTIDITISPASFTIPSGGTRTVVITADVTLTDLNLWAFGTVNFTVANNGISAANPNGSGANPNVSDAAMSIALYPVSGIIPELVEIETRRDAGSVTTDELTTLAAADLTFREYGLVPADETVGSVNQDSDRSDVYDDINDGTITKTLTVSAGALRLVAETYDSEAPDVDLFVVFDANDDGVATEAEEVCRSTTASADEYCDISNPEAGTYIIIAENWQGSTSQPDTFTLATAVVMPIDAGNLTVTGPDSVASEEPYTLSVFWDLGDAMEGDHFYGAFDIGSSPANMGNFGIVPVNIIRIADDVTKAVAPFNFQVGQPLTLTYTITIAPNVLPQDLTYYLTDTLPAGTTYVAGSVTGGATVAGSTLTWSGTMPGTDNRDPNYVQTTNATDPSCETPFGGPYVDLSDLGIGLSTASGDEAAFNAFTTGTPFNFYGVDHTGLQIYTNGFVRGPNTDALVGGSNNTAMGNPSLPNNLMAAFWDDLVVVLDAPTGRGVRLANAGTDATGISVIEFDQVESFANPTNRFTFEAIVARSVDDSPGANEIVLAYQTMTGVTNSATVGVENDDASLSAQYAFNGSAPITNGLVVCYDYQEPNVEPHVITYQVQVNNPVIGAEYTNMVQHSVNNPGSEVEMVMAQVILGRRIFLPIILKN